MSPICRGFALLLCAGAVVLSACSSHSMPSMIDSPNDAAQSVLHATPYVRLMAETSSVNNIAGFTLSTAGFKAQCRGESASPALYWSNAPIGTKSFAVVLFDETAEVAYWGIYDIGPSVNHLSAGIKPGSIATVQDYVAPCPPPGVQHRYVFTIYALDTTLNLNNSPLPPIESLLDAMSGHVIARASIIAFLQKT